MTYIYYVKYSQRKLAMPLQLKSEALVQALKRIIEEELLPLAKKRDDAQVKINEVVERMEAIQASHQALFGKKIEFVIPSAQPAHQKPTRGAQAKLGDALAAILKEHKTLDNHKAIELLRERGVKLSVSNPRNVLANLVRGDKEKRFVRLADGRIALNEKK